MNSNEIIFSCSCDTKREDDVVVISIKEEI
jgi:hypothetical protein